MKIRWSYAGKTTVLWTLKRHVHFYIPRGSILSSYVMSPLSNDVNSFNSLWPGGTIWQHRSGSTLAQVMACCLTAPNHDLNQCWLIINLNSSHIHLRAISQEIPQPSITKINLKIAYLNFPVLVRQHFYIETGPCSLPVVAFLHWGANQAG